MSVTVFDEHHVDQSVTIERVTSAAYKVPTDAPESDGTLQWESTTLVVVCVAAGDCEGFGYTYAPAAAARFVDEKLSDVVRERNAFEVERCWHAMVHAVRNAGYPGIAFAAISAIDTALWDLKARLLGLPLYQLWGAVRDEVPLYGSGGFTSYDDGRLQEQLGAWAAEGFHRVKMKVGREPENDSRRVALARQAIGDRVELFVDANGAYGRKQALQLAQLFAEQSNVVWFEEPRPSDDLDGLRLLRDRGPGGMDIAAGEYGYTPWYFRRMLASHAVDCLQADVTRCGGFTGFFKVAALCEAFLIPLSAHCAPYLHTHIACCVHPLRHVEYFHDHVRIADMLFDGHNPPIQGHLSPDPSRSGHGLTLKTSDAEKFAV
ncbi:MAG TPA: enolase C-terminal domain-like protein [Lacipirellulaceae bacterium]|nr:enolase C-terminal domain-like protein [Lacipirellulaceae bacterium]